MAIDDESKPISPLPEPWQMLNDLAFWLEWVRTRTAKDNPAESTAEMRDALRAAMLDLLTIVKFYRTDREHPSDLNSELVPRFTVMALLEDDTTAARGVFATEHEAADAAARLTAESVGISRVWIRRSLVSVALEQWSETIERVLTEMGVTEDELADVISHHPA